MTTPERGPAAQAHASIANTWRDSVRTSIDCGQFESFTLEHLIDLQRTRATSAGETR